jgi:tripartite-type tricarboxylate transporter receptor subunit TctC
MNFRHGNAQGQGLGRRTVLAAGAAALAGGLWPLAASAQPTPVKFILPNAAGSGVDALARAAQPALSRVLGTGVVVENQAGAGGVIGLQALARSAPDGNTLAFVSNNVVILPSVMKSLPFDMPGDFTPIAVVASSPLILVVNPSRLPASNAREFFALLKARPNAYNFASSGPGTILHLACEMVLDEGNVSARHIPYKGVGPMITDLIGGQVDFGVAALASVSQHLKTGALRAIGLTSPARTPAAPEIPTIAEQGIPGFSADGWIGAIGPKGMSPAAVKRAHDALVAAFADPAVKDAMAKQGNIVTISTPEQAQATFRRELVRFGAMVKKAGLEPQ